MIAPTSTQVIPFQPSRKWLILTALGVFSLIGFNGKAQEKIYPLRHNALLHEAQPQTHHSTASYKKKRDTTLTLPFIEDFSSGYYFPDDKKWRDNQVYVNANFHVDAPSIGVATFDGLDQRGYPYNDLGKNVAGSCDTLTSHPIDLSEFTESDSVLMSFFYQRKGLGDNPEEVDSLVLEFRWKTTAATGWRKMWGVNGGADTIASPLFNEIKFFIPDTLEKTPFFHDSFQVRFRNVGNRTGALDHWNLDYVHIDNDRSMLDSHTDFAFERKPNGLLRTYTSMPWEHFRFQFNAYLSTNLEFHYFNNWDVLQRPRVSYEIYDLSNDQLVYSPSNSLNPEFKDFERRTWLEANRLDLSKFNNVQTDELRLSVTLTTTQLDGEDLIATNNEYEHIQHFSNYYAYDDGSAEGGYGLDNTRSGGVALGFQATKPDTLRAIAIHFTSAREAIQNPQKFNLVVWKRILPKGSEEELIRMQGLTPTYTKTLNGFSIYKLDKPIAVDGSFFVGWEQFREYNFNVGFDANYASFNGNRPNPNLYFNSQGVWEQSKLLGTPMIRPVFGDAITVDVPEPEIAQKLLFECYPNPVSHILNIDFPESQLSEKLIQIHNTQGQLVYASQTNSSNKQVDLSFLPVGIYLLRISSDNYGSSSQRILKR